VSLGYLEILGASQRARKLEQMGRDCALENAPQLLTALETEISVAAVEMRRTKVGEAASGPPEKF
jgi:hypothetical protein